MNKPDFIIVGAMKAGTTQLVDFLAQSEDLFIVPDEVNYFDEKKNISFDEYLSYFVGAENVKKGEKTAAYCYEDSVPERIHSKLPDIKLIWVLRNPIDRAYSNYWHAVKGGHERDSFKKCVEDDDRRFAENIYKSYLHRSIYVNQVKRFLKFFGPDQMHFIIAEHLKANPQDEINKVSRFIGIPEYNLTIPDRVKNQTYLPRSVFFESWARNLFGSSLAYKVIHRLNMAKSPGYPKLDLELRRKLVSYFDDYNKELSEMLSIDLSCWNG